MPEPNQNRLARYIERLNDDELAATIREGEGVGTGDLGLLDALRREQVRRTHQREKDKAARYGNATPRS